MPMLISRAGLDERNEKKALCESGHGAENSLKTYRPIGAR